MQHGEEVKHAAAEALWREYKAQFGHHRFQAIFIKVTAGPVGTFFHLRIGFGDPQAVPGRIITNQLVEGAMPEHHGLLSKHLVQIVAPDLAVP